MPVAGRSVGGNSPCAGRSVGGNSPRVIQCTATVDKWSKCT